MRACRSSTVAIELKHVDMEPSPRSESEVQSAVRLLVGQLPDVRVWRNSVGELPATLKGGRRTRVKFGLCNGSSDLVAIVSPMGRWLVLEIKEENWRPAKSGKLFEHEEEQRQWIALVRRFGGVGGFVTCEAEAMELVEEARR
jgi:hypothetical protein